MKETVYIVGEALPNDSLYIAGVFNNHKEARRFSVKLNKKTGVVYMIMPHNVFSTQKELYADKEAKLTQVNKKSKLNHEQIIELRRLHKILKESFIRMSSL
jgi:hypothetical protein